MLSKFLLLGVLDSLRHGSELCKIAKDTFALTHEIVVVIVIIIIIIRIIIIIIIIIITIIIIIIIIIKYCDC